MANNIHIKNLQVEPEKRVWDQILEKKYKDVGSRYLSHNVLHISRFYSDNEFFPHFLRNFASKKFTVGKYFLLFEK